MSTFAQASMREISPSFLRSILTQEPYLNATHRPTTILDAHFSRKLDLSGVSSAYEIRFDRSTFERPAIFDRLGARGVSCVRCFFKNGASFEGVDVQDTLDLHSAQGGTLRLGSARIGLHARLTLARFTLLALRDANIGGDFIMEHALVRTVDADSAHFSRRVVIEHGHFHDVVFRNAVVGNILDLSNSTSATLDLDQIEVGKTVFLPGTRVTCIRRVQRCGRLILTEARIGGDLDLDGIRSVAVDANQMDVRGNVDIKHAAVDDAQVRASRVGGTISVVESSIATLDLTSAKIDGDLILRRGAAPLWRVPGALILRNVSVHAIDDSPWVNGHDPWPSGCQAPTQTRCVRLDLNGFTYSALGVFSKKHEADMGARSIDWWRDWLAREPYTPQPYEQLAVVLRESGHSETATELAYESKEREASSPETSLTRKLYLLWTRALIGYGYYPDKALFWAILLFGIGVFVLRYTGDGTKLRSKHEPLWLSQAVYSFDTLIPLITLRKMDETVELGTIARVYFYFQKLAGYVLASFLLAGLSGLTK